ncbi:MAG TPA: hypothetical protein VEK74_05605 [Burkholderiaceae bacterium]|nr:hypothetical protein [Burkholderiaceae bacterium]
MRDAELPHTLKIRKAVCCDATEAASGLRGRTECVPGLGASLPPNMGFYRYKKHRHLAHAFVEAGGHLLLSDPLA